MPETINKPKEDTGLENKSTEAGHVDKSPVKGSEHKHENMDFEDEVNIIPPSGGMTLQEMNSYATKKTAIQGLFNATLVSCTFPFIPERKTMRPFYTYLQITKDARLLKGILTEDDIQSGQQVAQLVLVVISLIIEVMDSQMK